LLGRIAEDGVDSGLEFIHFNVNFINADAHVLVSLFLGHLCLDHREVALHLGVLVQNFVSLLVIKSHLLELLVHALSKVGELLHVDIDLCVESVPFLDGAGNLFELVNLFEEGVDRSTSAVTVEPLNNLLNHLKNLFPGLLVDVVLQRTIRGNVGLDVISK